MSDARRLVDRIATSSDLNVPDRDIDRLYVHVAAVERADATGDAVGVAVASFVKTLGAVLDQHITDPAVRAAFDQLGAAMNELDQDEINDFKRQMEDEGV